MEQIGKYFYKVYEDDELKAWKFSIYATNSDKQNPINSSSDLYDSQFRAAMAAIGYISLLENKEFEPC